MFKSDKVSQKNFGYLSNVQKNKILFNMFNTLNRL